MKKKSAILKTVAGVTAFMILSLSVSSPVFAFDSAMFQNSDFHNAAEHGKSHETVIGVSFSGDLSFENFGLNVFAKEKIGVSGGSGARAKASLFAVDSGMITATLPLFTFGKKISYPGIFYNADGKQLYEHVIKATEGNSNSQGTVMLYCLGGALLAGGIAAVASSGSSGGIEYNLNVQQRDNPGWDFDHPEKDNPYMGDIRFDMPVFEEH